MFLLFLFLIFTNNVTSLKQIELDALCEINLPSFSCPINNTQKVCTNYIFNNPLIVCSPDQTSIIRLSYYQPFNGTLSSSIGKFSDIVNINLKGNEMNGTIPTQLGNLSSLEYLSLSYNKFEGIIPTQFMNLKKLTYLGLSSTRLGGTIPTYIGNLTALETLDLSGDMFDIFNSVRLRFTGMIPTQIGYLINLKVLDLSRNQLSGSIPMELEKLKNLISLDLKYNKLSGTIPFQILQLENLDELRVDSLVKCPYLTYYSKPKEVLLKACDNIQLYIQEDISLNGTISFSNVTLENRTTLVGVDLTMSAEKLELSPNTKIQLTNSTISVSGNITISSLNLILGDENRNQPAISTTGCLNIQPDTELNVTFASGIPQTNQTFFSFACKTGNFSRVQVNGKTARNFVLSNNFAMITSNIDSSGEEKAINLFSFAVLLFIQIFVFFK